MNISIIGTGYVGLVTGTLLAAKGHSVIAVDLDKSKVDLINAGKSPIYEPGLADLLSDAVFSGRLRATTDLAEAVTATELTFIAVGTPFDGKRIDLRYICTAAAQIRDALREKTAYHVVVVKSTVVPGTTDEVVQKILEYNTGKRAGADFGLGMNPEFLSEGTAVRDFNEPDRLVFGGIDQRTLLALTKVYAAFEGVPVVLTSNKTAEMIKYTSNALLATLISFSNEIGNFCSDLGGIDALEVMRGVHLSTYLTPFIPEAGRVRAPIAAFLEAGCGFGGSCLPKDVKALIARGGEVGSDLRLLREVIGINAAQGRRMIDLLRKGLNRPFSGLPIAVLGLAFKPETDDIRESPAFRLIDILLDEEAEVFAYDPIAMPAAKKVFPKEVTFCASLEEALSKAEGVLLVTAWPEFAAIPELLTKLGRDPVFVDGRRQLDKNKIKHYYGIGL